MKKYLLYLISLVIFLQSCDSTYNYAPLNTEAFETIDAFFEEIILVPDTFNIDQSQENTLLTEGNAEVLLPPCILALPDGTPLCDLTGDGPCPVKIELVEMYKNKDFVLNEMTTITENGEILATGGIFKMRATFADSILLTVAEGKSFKVKVPKGNTPTDSASMNLYSVDTTTLAGATWTLQSTSVEDTVGFHAIEYDKFNDWFACGYEIEAAATTTRVSIVSSEERFDADISRVYLAFDDFHSLVGTTYNKGSFVAENIPTDEPVTAIAIHTDGTQLLFATGTGNTGTDEEILIRLEPTSVQVLHEKLSEIK